MFFRADFGEEKSGSISVFFLGGLGRKVGVIFGEVLEGIKKVSAESFKKESAVCRNEKRSLLKKKAQLFLHNF